MSDDPSPDAGTAGAAGDDGTDVADGVGGEDTNDGTDGEDDGTAIEDLRSDLADLEERVEERTLHRDEVEGDLREYVRRRIRRGHARGWGPYLVLLYGTAMTIGAFHFLSGGWAILAMIVVWLSTLGLFVLMVLTGLALSATGGVSRAVDLVRRFRR